MRKYRNCTALTAIGNSLYKHGHNRKGTQRYVCRSCGKTFDPSIKTNLFVNTKLKPEVWMKYAECFVDRMTLREAAEICEVSLPTSFFMRRRLLEIITHHLPSFEVKSGCGAELDEIYFHESFKGNHRKSGFILPRKARHHGAKNHKRGISNNLVCVMTGINDSKDMFYDVACKGRMTSAVAVNVLTDKIDSGAVITTDKHKGYIQTMKELRTACHKAYDAEDHAKLANINSLHSKMRAFVAKFRGISTKWLSQYLAWFKWLKCFADHHDNKVRTVVKQFKTTSYELTRKKMKKVPVPFN